MYNILIVDDNPYSIESIKENIDWKSLDANISGICYNGASALEILRNEKIDLIISDIEMPDIDGISMCKKALELNPSIKVLLISAYDKFEYAKSAVQMGVYDYIEKPIDFEYMSKKLSDAILLIQKEARNAKLLEKSRPVLIERFYSELIHSDIKEAKYKLASYEDFLGLKLDYRFYVTMIIKIENAYEYKNATSIASYEMKLYDISDTISDCCQVFDDYYLLKELDHFTLIICQNSSSSEHISRVLYKIADEIIGKHEGSGLNLILGIGNIVNDIWNLGLSYQSAKHALEYRFFFPQKNVFDAGEVLGRSFSLEPLKMINENELITLICQRKEPEIKSWLNTLKSDFSGNQLSKDLYFISIHSLLDKLLKFIYELNLDTADLQKSIIETYSKLDSFSTTEDLFGWIESICIAACNKVDASLTTYHSQLSHSVVEYINANYMNADLSLNELAKYANVSPSYLSAMFKKAEGISIIDCITNIRIDNACTLLQTTSLTLKEISQKCGYANQYYFSTAFKKKIGMSPSAYRDNASSL